MLQNLLRKYWLHIFLWAVMLVYFVFGTDLVTFAFTKTGKPIETDGVIPIESDRITFVVEDLETYIKDGKSLYNLYGWAFILPEKGQGTDSYQREIVLASVKKIYFFQVESEYRNPGPQSLFAEADVDLNTLGFNTLIAEDSIQPGKYRIGIIFRNPSTGLAYYWDKPAHYLVKTPNTLTFK